MKKEKSKTELDKIIFINIIKIITKLRKAKSYE